MANIPIWNNNPGPVWGNTPFGFYDNDLEFQQEAPLFATWASRRLGYPVVEVELQDINFYAAFEEAITTYGNEVYQWKIRESYLAMQGNIVDDTITFNNKLVTPNLGSIINIAENYASEAGVGGYTTYYTGSIEMTASVQDYDLKAWATQQGISGSGIEIKKIFGESIDVSSISFDIVDRAKIVGLVCKEHGIFDQWMGSLLKNIGCPDCGLIRARPDRIKNAKAMRKRALDKGKAKYVSKSETKWLDSLDVPVRQKWLEDVQYSVDGYDASTNTVYLYHGRFWHGCLETYNPDDIHPILKVKMKQLHKQTLSWEKKIKDAGYNLVVQWGK
jgi:hypothetical protein